MKQRIYIDTSVIGGYFDDEFKEPTRLLFDRLIKEEVIFVISDLLELELIHAPSYVRELLDAFSVDLFERLSFNEEAEELAQRYIREKVVGKTSVLDCRHIALATVNMADVLASWNFKHIVNLDKIKSYNSINVQSGYPMIEVRSPLELLSYGD